MENIKTRNCECCSSEYGTGKDYGNYNCIFPNPNVETKGLCEFCNPSNIWYIPDLKCHDTKSTI